MKKRCFKCKKKKEINSFYPHPRMGDGHLGKCKTCTKKDVAARYIDPEARKRIIEYERLRFRDPERKRKTKEYQKTMRLKSPGKWRARRKFRNAVHSGLIKVEPCQTCGNPKSEGHHTDYRKPLQVQWLCRVHHMEAEGKITYLPTTS